AWRTKQLCEYGFQRVGPDLITLDGWMEFVSHHAVKQHVVPVSKLVVNVHVPDRPSIGELREILVDLSYFGHHRDVVVAWKYSHQEDRGLRRLSAHCLHNGFQSP